MTSKATTPEQYLKELPADRKEPVTELRNVVLKNLPKGFTAKLDMGKACTRFKNPEQIPYKLIGELVKKISVKDWIETYEKNIKR